MQITDFLFKEIRNYDVFYFNFSNERQMHCHIMIFLGKLAFHNPNSKILFHLLDLETNYFGIHTVNSVFKLRTFYLVTLPS